MCDGYGCRLKVTMAAMLAKANVTNTQQITLYLLDQYFLRYHEFTMKTKPEIYVFCVILTIKSNKYIIIYSET